MKLSLLDEEIFTQNEKVIRQWKKGLAICLIDAASTQKNLEDIYARDVVTLKDTQQALANALIENTTTVMITFRLALLLMKKIELLLI